jgi:uncharacterized protein YoxC
MKELKQKINQMQDDIDNKFDKVTQIKHEFDKKKTALQKDKEELKSLKSGFVEQVLE